MKGSPQTIKRSVTTTEYVKLSAQECKEVCLKYLQDTLLPGEWIDTKGILWSEEDCGHGSPLKYNHGSATWLQLRAWDVLQELRARKED